jgi:hypothetical protein
MASRIRLYQTVACPSCGAKPGDPCFKYITREPVKHVHVTRRNKYRYDIGSMDKPIILHAQRENYHECAGDSVRLDSGHP